MSKEVWKDVIVKGFENCYEVSNMGRIKNKRTGYILNPSPNPNGYLGFTMCNGNDNRKKVQVHRLVAEAFIPNPKNKPEVDHINTNRMDNRAINLRWATRKENLDNPITKERVKKACSKNIKKATEAVKKKVICISTMEIFNSVEDAAAKYSTYRSDINKACTGKWKYAGSLEDGTKLEWAYYEEGKEYRSKLYNGYNCNNIKVKCNETGQVFNSVKEAATWCGLKENSHTCISACCRGKMKQCRGYTWSYVQDTEE